MVNPQWREWLAAEVWQSSSFRGKVLLVIGCAVGFALALGAAAAVGFPHDRNGYVSAAADALLLHQGAPWAALLMIVILVPLLVTVGSVIAGSIRHDAGLFVAGFSLCAWSERGGTIRVALIDAHGPSVLLLMVLEVMILYAVVVAARRIVSPMQRLGLVVDDAVRDETIDAANTTSQKVQALITSVVTMIVILSILVVNDSKHQATIGLFVAAMGGTCLGRLIFPVDDSLWYLLACPIVAILGYVGCCISPSGFTIGELDGLFAPLARALPLDFAGAGLCGSILGYWIARRWQRPPDDENNDNPETTDDSARRSS